jgi:hypothetical protein
MLVAEELQMGVSSFTIWRTLHEQGLRPYHLQRDLLDDVPLLVRRDMWYMMERPLTVYGMLKIGWTLIYKIGG